MFCCVMMTTLCCCLTLQIYFFVLKTGYSVFDIWLMIIHKLNRVRSIQTSLTRFPSQYYSTRNSSYKQLTNHEKGKNQLDNVI